jgi:hypothetical protein
LLEELENLWKKYSLLRISIWIWINSHFLCRISCTVKYPPPREWNIRRCSLGGAMKYKGIGKKMGTVGRAHPPSTVHYLNGNLEHLPNFSMS